MSRRPRRIVETWYALVPQPIRFLFVGGVNTVLGLSIIWFNMSVLGLGQVTANAFAYALMLPLSMWTFARGVFAYSGRLGRAIAVFLAVFAVSAGSSLGAIALLVNYFAVTALAAQIAGLTIYIAVYYPLNRTMFAYLKRSPYAALPVGAEK